MTMVETSTLLQMIQFVGLITPALAILIELLIRFHGGISNLKSNNQLPYEVQILFIGFSFLLFGGMILGLQLGLRLSNTTTQIAALLVFGSLPFLILTTVVMNLRISGFAGQSTSLAQRLLLSVNYTTSVAITLLGGLIVYILPVSHYNESINSLFDWWIFQTTVDPVWFFYGVGSILVYKLHYSLWSHDVIPSDSLPNVVKQVIVISLSVLLAYSLTGLSPFAIYVLAENFGVAFFSKESPLTAIPAIWAAIWIVAVLYAEIEPSAN